MQLVRPSGYSVDRGRSELVYTSTRKIKLALREQSMHHRSNGVPIFTSYIDFAIDN